MNLDSYGKLYFLHTIVAKGWLIGLGQSGKFGVWIDKRPNRNQTRKMTSLIGDEMHTWPVQDAKARFSEFLDACLLEGPQMVTRRGTEAAVLVPVQEWRRMQSAARPSLKQLLLSDQARTDMSVAPRGRAQRRPVEPML